MVAEWRESRAGSRPGTCRDMVCQEMARGSRGTGAAHGDRPGILFLKHEGKPQNFDLGVEVAGQKVVSIGIRRKAQNWGTELSLTPAPAEAVRTERTTSSWEADLKVSWYHYSLDLGPSMSSSISPDTCRLPNFYPMISPQCSEFSLCSDHMCYISEDTERGKYCRNEYISGR